SSRGHWRYLCFPEHRAGLQLGSRDCTDSSMDDFTQPTLHCPSCSEPMHSLELQRRAVGKLRIDLCFGCCLIWFDQNESAQLAPAAVIELFQQINSHRDARRMPVAAALPCPRCT